MFEKDKVMQAFEKEFEHYKKKNINLYGLINEVGEFMFRLHTFSEKIHHYIIWGDMEQK